MRWVAIVCVLAACSRHPSKLDETAAKRLFDIVKIDDAPPGVSDLTLDDKGTIWAVAERDRFVLELTTPLKKHPLDGVESGLDTEALTWLGGNHFALGIEATQAPVAAVAFADLEADHLVVKRTRALSSAELGVQIAINHGIEGLCGHGDELLAATESGGKLADGTRGAALARLRGDPGAGQAAPPALEVAKLRLTSDAGKISALSCRFTDDGTADVLAIERHYGVARILHFVAKRGDTDITPEVVLDLEPVLHDSINPEGIARLPDGRMIIVNDNQGNVVSGPTELLYFHPR